MGGCIKVLFKIVVWVIVIAVLLTTAITIGLYVVPVAFIVVLIAGLIKVIKLIVNA